MDLENYRNFLAIVEHGNITAAANAVLIAQPALSKQLKAMEEYYGAKLLHTKRGSRQIVLTEAGRALYQRAKYICSLEEAARREVDGITGGLHGSLRLSVAPSRTEPLISRYLKEFCRLYPSVSYEIYEAGKGEQYQQLLNGLSELGFLSTPLSWDEGSFQVLFRRQEAVVAVFQASSAYLDGLGPTVQAAQLCHLPLSLSGGCAELFSRHCASQGLKPRILSVNTSRNTALRWAANDISVAITVAELGESFPDLVVKPISDLKGNVEKSIIKVKGRPLSAVARNFLRFYARRRGAEQVGDLARILAEDDV